jgi:SAM-dependent methyltransferase
LHDDREAPLLTEYDQLRRRVLFEVWRPGARTVTLQTQLCQCCGLVVYAPRPTANDISAKYEFLLQHERSVGGAAESARGRQLDLERAERTFRLARSAFGSRQLRVLDFGGGDGKQLGPFVAEGFDCFIVDYNPQPIAGVTKLGDTLDDVEPRAQFDLVLCSHVLEHLPEPAATLTQLGGYLSPGGMVYGEVPLEIWHGIGIEREPVTHVNFFTRRSFEELFIRSGFQVRHSAKLSGSYGEYHIDVATVLAERTEVPANRPPAAGAVAEAERLMRPTLWLELTRRLPSRRGVLRRLGLSR